ncbi:hypothetical protein C8Q73DRAFT_298992 [Cubamyces lactineus]|nr:hypothetical protein C8Q73DRAFT_298992 [Cubamyces lactineus]
MEGPCREENGQHASPSNVVNAQESLDRPQQGQPTYNTHLDSWLSRDPVEAPSLIAWWFPVVGITYLCHLRVRRRYPRTFPTLTSLKLGELYGCAATVPVAVHHIALSKKRIIQDKDLRNVEGFARHERTRLPEIMRWYAKHRNLVPSFKGESADGTKRPVQAQPTLAWAHAHLLVFDYAYGFYCRKLYERFASKYPDISPQDWDTCITYIASIAGNYDPLGYCRSLGYTIPFAMMARRWPVRLLTPALNGLQRGLFYCFVSTILMYGYHAWAFPLTLQNKQRVAEMLREAYLLDQARSSSPSSPPSSPTLREPAAKK